MFFPLKIEGFVFYGRFVFQRRFGGLGPCGYDLRFRQLEQGLGSYDHHTLNRFRRFILQVGPFQRAVFFMGMGKLNRGMHCRTWLTFLSPELNFFCVSQLCFSFQSDNCKTLVARPSLARDLVCCCCFDRGLGISPHSFGMFY